MPRPDESHADIARLIAVVEAAGLTIDEARATSLLSMAAGLAQAARRLAAMEMQGVPAGPASALTMGEQTQ